MAQAVKKHWSQSQHVESYMLQSLHCRYDESAEDSDEDKPPVEEKNTSTNHPLQVLREAKQYVAAVQLALLAGCICSYVF